VVAVSQNNDTDGFLLRAGEFQYVQVGTDQAIPVSNVGIAAFSARRDYEDPVRVLVFARLVNAAMDEMSVVTRLRVDDGEPSLKRVTIPGANEEGPGEATVTYTVELQTSALLELSHNRTDDLPADDTARLVMPAPTRPRIALVYDQDGIDPFLEDLIDAMEPQVVEPIARENYELLSDEQLRHESRFDLFVFDRVTGHRLPSVPSLTVGGVPAGIEEIDPEHEDSLRMLSWDRQHPLMRFVSLDTVVFRGFSGFRLPVGSTPLAYGPTGPVIGVVKTRGARHVLVGFALPRSNWPVHVSVTVFLQNVLDYLTLAGSLQSGIASQPGEPISVRAKPDRTELVISGPIESVVPVSGGTLTSLPALPRTGLYGLEGALEPYDRLAVCLLSEQESDLRPRPSVTVNATDAGAANVAQAVPLELWPWLVGLILLLLVTEWLFYCHRLQAIS
jgi:hypothetical protein